MILSEAKKYYSEEYSYHKAVSSKGFRAKNDFELLMKMDHINLMFQKHINRNMEKYFDKYLDYIKDQSKNGNLSLRIKLYFDMLIEHYNSEHKEYLNCLDINTLEVFNGNFSAFKKWISDKCPIIRGCRNSRSKVMTQWKIDYNCLDAQELYNTVMNIVRFAAEYHNAVDLQYFQEIDDWEAFGLKELEEGEYYLGGVIGTGIVSTILYHLYPDVFCGNFKLGLWSLYFLTDLSYTDMSGDSSEYVMVNDNTYGTTILQTHNFYYPYFAFLLYSLRIYRMLTDKFADIGVSFPEEYRFVLCNDFYAGCCKVHEDALATFAALDDLEKNGKIALPF
jgi:hypothetical protein